MPPSLSQFALHVFLLTPDQSAADGLGQVFGKDCILRHLGNEVSDLSPLIDAGSPSLILVVRNTVDAAFLSDLKGMIERAPLPVIVFVERDPDHLAPTAIRYGITSFVVAGFKPDRVPSLIEVSMERFKLHSALRDELLKSREELAARKVIERAKGLLMEKKQLSEQEAYRSLRELAMRQSKPIKEVAETLLAYSDLLP